MAKEDQKDQNKMMIQLQNSLRYLGKHNEYKKYSNKARLHRVWIQDKIAAQNKAKQKNWKYIILNTRSKNMVESHFLLQDLHDPGI